MRKDQWRGHVVTCALLAFICAGFSYIAFRTNSWAKWRKSTGNNKNVLSEEITFRCITIILLFTSIKENYFEKLRSIQPKKRIFSSMLKAVVSPNFKLT